jgi:hypothetical protein
MSDAFSENGKIEEGDIVRFRTDNLEFSADIVKTLDCSGALPAEIKWGHRRGGQWNTLSWANSKKWLVRALWQDDDDPTEAEADISPLNAFGAVEEMSEAVTVMVKWLVLVRKGGSNQ